MPVVPLSVVADLVASHPPAAGATKVLAVDGPSGSGKTTLTRRLRRMLGAPSMHLDAIYPGWDGLAAAPGLLVQQVLEPLGAGRAAAYRRWDWDEGRWAESHVVAPVPVLIVEGVGSGAAACAPYLTALVWIEAPFEVRLSRGIARDGEAYRPHWERWARQEQTMFAADRTRERADLVLDGDSSLPYDPATELVEVSRSARPDGR